jgi:glucose/mannose transport system substrate-binding protein
MANLKSKIVTIILATIVLAAGLLAAMTADGAPPPSTVPSPSPPGVQIIVIGAEDPESLSFLTGTPPLVPTVTAASTTPTKTPVPPILPHQPRPTSTGPLSGKLEFFSWWVVDQSPALDALIARYPDVKVINAAITGSDVNARMFLKHRILAGFPPDTFQTYGGQGLIGTWATTGWVEDLSFLYAAEGWYDVYPQALLDLHSDDGGIWTVPATVWRTNMIWFSPARLSEWGVNAPVTWDEFLAVCPTLQEAGVTPLVLGDLWTVNQLWETVALSVLGVDGWNAVWRGEKAWTDPDMLAVWALFSDILDCTNIKDINFNSYVEWQEIVDRVMDGQAAFVVMGDWTTRYLNDVRGLQPGVDFNWSLAPGTGGLFMMMTDAFTLPWNAENRDNALAWLKLIGSREGQDILNPLLGSGAPRLDSDLSLYDAYHQSAAIGWQTNTIVGSMTHGMVANERFVREFGDVMKFFTHDRDVHFAVNALQTLCIQCCICP